MNHHMIFRAKRLIENIINKLQLDLTGTSVLTEAGSGYYLFTPLIAAMAGAKKVFIWCRDSSYGNAEELQYEFQCIVKLLQVESVEFVWALNERPMEHVNQADIITNLGFIRPLDHNLLSHVRPQKTVISLMFEAWEIRLSDIDIAYCKANKIKVAGTWENHPDLRIFDGCGPLAIKMANEAGFEVFQNNIIVWSDDEFGKIIEASFKKYGAKRVIKTTDINVLKEEIKAVDFIFVCDYDEKRVLIGDNGLFDLDLFKEKNPGLGVVHLYGKIDGSHINEHGINIYPRKKGKEMHMTFTLAHIGPILMINLHAAGLKVAESVLKKKYSKLVQPITF